MSDSVGGSGQSGTLVGHRSFTNQIDCLARRIDQCVERWNDWSHRSQRTDAENYVKGNIKFALEYVARGRLDGSELFEGYCTAEIPTHYAVCERRIFSESERKIGDEVSDYIARQPHLFIRWDKQLVLVEDIHFMDQEQKLIPSRITVWPQSAQGAIKTCPGIMGEATLDGGVQPVCFFAERELQFSAFGVAGATRGHDLPIGMAKRRTDIVDGVSRHQACFVYDGFVSFRKDGAFFGVGTGFKDEDERSRLAKKFVKIRNVFSGPINLEKCAICHAS